MTKKMTQKSCYKCININENEFNKIFPNKIDDFHSFFFLTYQLELIF